MNDTTLPAPVVELLQPEHAAAYKRLRDGMLTRYPEVFTSDAETEHQRPVDSYADRLRAGDGGFTLGVLQAGELLGALTCEIPSRAKERHLGHLVAMMVAPEHQGRGLGAQLLSATVTRARQAGGLLQLALTVTRGNGAAVALYERAGFHTCGCLPRALRLADGRLFDKLQMVLPLDAG